MKRQVSVLVVDDNADLLDTFYMMLKRRGYNVDTAEDGHSAVDRFKRHHFDVTLMDVVMPGMNGFQATRELSRDPRTARIPVLMVTTKGDETDRIWGMRQGAADYLVKPITEAQLVERVKAVLEE